MNTICACDASGIKYIGMPAFGDTADFPPVVIVEKLQSEEKFCVGEGQVRETWYRYTPHGAPNRRSNGTSDPPSHVTLDIAIVHKQTTPALLWHTCLVGARGANPCL